MATRDEINEALRAMLETATTKKVGLGGPPLPPDPDNWPAIWPPLPYAVVWPQELSPGEGGMDDPNEERDYTFQITCVGKDVRQAGWMSSKVEAAIMSLRPGGGPVHEIPLVGHSVLWRLSISGGAIIPAGDDLFQTDDTYTLHIGRAA